MSAPEQPQVSDPVLEATPGRLLTYLLAVSRYGHIRRRLLRRGYSPALQEQAHGWIHDLGRLDERTAPSESDPEVKAALNTLNSTDEDALTLVAASLQYKFPAALAYLVDDLSPSTQDLEAVKTISTLLDRMKVLEQGTGPTPTRAEGKQALQAIAEKGLNGAWRERMAALVQTVRAIPDDEEQAEEQEQFEARRRDILLRLRAFFEEWSAVARVEFKGRRDLIRLGLAQPRSRSEREEPKAQAEVSDG